MRPVMSEKEFALFSSFIGKSERYLEFGCGGSTYVASSHVKSWIISIDSGAEWLDKVRDACKGNQADLELVLADIGTTGNWGFPTDPATKDRWPKYHTDVWSNPKSKDADLYFVDGRFRVACFAQVVLHCRPDAIIGIHDFKMRPQYHAVYGIAREIASAENISFFQPMHAKMDVAHSIIEEYKYIPE